MPKPDFSKDPFKNPDNTVKSWGTPEQGNQKIIQGPDKDVHRGYEKQSPFGSFITSKDRPFRK